MASALSVAVNIGARMLPSINSTASAVERRVGLMGRYMKVKAAETRVAFKEMSAAMSPLAAMAAAAGLGMGLKGIFGEGAEYQHQIILMRNMGRTSTEVAQAVAAAHRTMFNVPTSSLNESLKLLNETTLAFGGLGHAMENLSFNSKMGALLKGVMGEDYNESGGFNQLVRALEIRGGKLSVKDYQRQANSLFRAMIVSGGKVNPEELLGFAQQAGPAGRRYSEGFLTRVVPSLIQEFGGQRAGTMATALYNQFNGKVAVGGKSITEEWVRLGLVPKNGTMGNLSRTGWSPGSLKGYDLAMSNPLEYIERVMMPAMRAKGLNTGDAKTMSLEAQKLFGRETAKRLADTLFNPAQLARVNADMKLYDKASGVDKAYSTALYSDPKMAAMATANSLKNLETTLGKSVWQSPTVVKSIISIARAVNWLAGAFDRHPAFAKGVVALMGFGAVTAILKTFNFALRWLFAPLTGLLRLIGAPMWRMFGPLLFRGILGAGTLIRTGLMALAPAIGEGLMAAFALLSNPVGWAVLAGIAVVAAGALIWHFRKQVGGFLSRSWGALKGAFLAVPWANIGMAIADALTGGLASKLPAIGAAISSWWSAHAPTWAGGAAPKPVLPAHKPIAGHRRYGGPVVAGRRYIVGEAGQEEFVPGRSGVIVPHGAGGGRGASIHVGNIVIQAANDPEATAIAVRRELQRMANGQASYLSD